MDEHLLGYLLNALDGDTLREVEAYLEQNPEGHRRLDLLRQALAPLEADRAEIDPPPGLVVRTLAHVAEYCCRDLPRAPLPFAGRFSGGRPLWRRADVLVAASLLLLLVGFGIPWVGRMRDSDARLACQENLRQFARALQTYHDRNGGFPHIAVSANPPRNVAGLVVPMLISSGDLPQEVNVRCPANGSAQLCSLTLQQVLEMSDEEFDKQAAKLSCCYSYSLGYRDAAGVYQGLRQNSNQSAGQIALMADRPPLDARTGNSPNHGGRGQNVLFVDGSVKFCPQRVICDDDIYLNKEGRDKAGLDPLDSVLGHSAAQP